MIEEPYRWVEAIANRREYIEHQLAGGSPIAALSYRDGILLFTLGRERQKIFEIYDRIAMGGIGHPADIERLRMAAIEVASTEGFTRSADDVSLRRLATYSLSPALKTAFEQVYGAPYLARLLFAELGRHGGADFFVRLEYDGAIHVSGGALGRTHEDFAVISGTAESTAKMERFLRTQKCAAATFDEALHIACDAWMVGHLALEQETEDLPTTREIAEKRIGQLAAASIEAAVLDRTSTLPMSWRALADENIRPVLEKKRHA